MRNKEMSSAGAMITIEFEEGVMLRQIPGMVKSPFREVPIHFKVAGLDLFTDSEVDPPVTLDMSPLALARWGLFNLCEAKRTGVGGYELDEHGEALLFKMDSEDVLVHVTFRSRTVRANYEKLVQAWLEFGDRVRQFVLRAYPGLDATPSWAGWLAGEETPPAGADKNWQAYYAASMTGFDHVDAVEN